MRYILLIFCFALQGFSSIYSQVNIFVVEYSKYQIRGDSITNQKQVIKQKTFNNDGNLLLYERLFDPETNKETLYTTFFYDTLNRMISKEIYSIDKKPVRLFKYAYNKKGDTLSIEIFAGNKDTALFYATRSYNYDNLNRITTIITKNNKNRTIEKETRQYNKEMIIPIKLLIKYNYGEKCTKTNLYTYDSLNAVSSLTVKSNCNDTTCNNYKIQYTRNKKGKIIEEVIYVDNVGKATRFNKYRGDIELESYCIRDNNDKLIEYIGMRNYWHKVGFINTKSYFQKIN